MAERDPYSALGVPQGAAATEIKTAYRRRARVLHPDVNESDPNAAEKFKELVAAYELLSDPLRRSAYDRHRDRFGEGTWDFASPRSTVARRESRAWSGHPQVWTVAQVVPLRERTGLSRGRRAHAPSLERSVVSPDLRRLATHRGDVVQLLDVESGRSVARLKFGGEGIAWLSFSPDGRWLITEGLRGTVLWDAMSGREVDRLNVEGAGNVSFSSDGSRLATAVHTLADVSDPAFGRPVAQFGHEAPLDSIALSGDGRRLATAALSTARVWDIQREEELARMPHEKPVVRMQLSPDGQWLATSTTVPRSGWTPSVLHLWDVESGDEIARLQHGCWVDRVVFSPDGGRLVTDSNGTVQLWDLQGGGRPACIGPVFSSSELAFSPDGRWLATAFRRNAYVWDAATGRQLACLDHTAEVVGVAVGRDGKRIGTASHGGSAQGADSLTARVWVQTDRLSPAAA